MLSYALRCLAVLAMLGGVTAAANAQVPLSQPTTFILTPVPEGSGDINGPALGAIGRARAAAVAQSLTHADVSAVYSTEDRQAQETARIVADELGVQRIPYDYNRQDPEKFVRYLFGSTLPTNGGKALLVVIPRNDIPSFIRHAAGVDEDEVGRVNQSDLFVVTITPTYASVVRASVEPGARHVASQ